MRFHRHNLKILALALVALSLAGCAGLFTPPPPPAIVAVPHSKPAARSVDMKAICQKVTTLTPAQRDALTALVNSLAATDPLIGVIADYKRMRDEARACLDFK